jgi:hypothetical protein
MPIDDHREGGVFFTNDRKTNATHPDFQGSVTIGPELLGTLNILAGAGRPLKFNLAGWKKTSAKGTHFLSLKPSEERLGGNNDSRAPVQRAAPSPWDDSDAPF